MTSGAAEPESRGTLWRRTDGSVRIIWRIALAWLVFVAALLAAGIFGKSASHALGVSTAFINGALVTAIVLPAIYLLLRYTDRRTFSSLGLSPRLPQIAWMFGAMFAVALPAALALAVCVDLGWVRIVSINPDAGVLPFVLAMLAYIFFFEALPEETVFRGYLYTNLNTVFPRWLALLGQMALFILAPIAAVFVHSQLLGETMQVGGADQVTVVYVLLLVTFGGTLQLCRIVTGSLWASIGFHLGFISLSRFMGPGERAIVRVEDTVPNTVQEVVVFLGGLVAPALLLLLVSLLRFRKTGWTQRAGEIGAE